MFARPRARWGWWRAHESSEAFRPSARGARRGSPRQGRCLKTWALGPPFQVSLHRVLAPGGHHFLMQLLSPLFFRLASLLLCSPLELPTSSSSKALSERHTLSAGRHEHRDEGERREQGERREHGKGETGGARASAFGSNRRSRCGVLTGFCFASQARLASTRVRPRRRAGLRHGQVWFLGSGGGAPAAPPHAVPRSGALDALSSNPRAADATIHKPMRGSKRAWRGSAHTPLSPPRRCSGDRCTSSLPRRAHCRTSMLRSGARHKRRDFPTTLHLDAAARC
jgi:hypothetical protein